jgi:hypothetical protein
LFESGDALPEEIAERLALARERQSWLGRIRAALKARDLTAIERLVELAPPGAVDRMSESERARIGRMTARKRALARLRKAIQSGDDARILQAMHEVERAGARIDDAQTWNVIQRVVERAGLVEQIVAAGSADPVDDRQLSRLLPVARMMAMQDHPAFTGDVSWAALEGHVARGAALRRIRRAIDHGDPKAIRAAAFPDITGALDILATREREIVERSRRVR